MLVLMALLVSNVPAQTESGKLIVVARNYKWGFMSRDGKLAIPLKFDYVGEFVENRAVACLDIVIGLQQFGRLGVAETRFRQIEDNLNQILTNGLVERADIWGFYDPGNKFIALPQFLPNWAELRGKYPNANGTIVTAGRRCGFLDLAGKTVVPINFASVRDFSDGLAAVRNADEADYGFIDSVGRFVIGPRFEAAGDFAEGLASVKVRNRWGFIDKTGKFRIRPRFEETMGGFYKGLTAAKKGGKWGLVDREGREVGGFLYDDIDWLEGYREEGLVAVETNGKEGFIDLGGRMIILPTFDYVGPFRDGLATAQVSGSYGFIDRSGKVAIEAVFEEASSFSEGLAKIILDGKVGYIDRLGRAVIAPRYDDGEDFSDGYARVSFGPRRAIRGAGKKYGYIDRSGRIVFPFKFDFASDFKNGVAYFEIGDQQCEMTRDGVLLLCDTAAQN